MRLILFEEHNLKLNNNANTYTCLYVKIELISKENQNFFDIL